MTERKVLEFAIRGIDAEIVDSAYKISRSYWEYKKEPLRICELTEMRREIGSRLKSMDAAETGEEPEAAAAEDISRTELLELALYAVEHKMDCFRSSDIIKDEKELNNFIEAVTPLIEKRDILRKALEEAKTK